VAEIKLESVQKRFGEFMAVRGSSFTIRDGEFFALLGPSGCGKTTTLRMIAGLELPSAGRILLDGDDVTFRRASMRDIAFVFQLFALYPHLNVRRNIAFPLRCQRMARLEIASRVDEVASLLRIEHLLDLPVSALSGGDRQRVALGRAIVRRPKAFLMDEPLGALDAEFRAVMRGELRALHDRLNTTTIYVTHDQIEAMAMADTILVMNHGVIEQCGSPQAIYDRPASMFVAEFIGDPPMSLLRFRSVLRAGTSRVGINGVRIDVPVVLEDLGEIDVAVGVRPEHVRFADEGALRGRVVSAEYLGTTQVVTVTTEHGSLKARLPADVPAASGTNVALTLATDRLSVFDVASGRAIKTAVGERGRHG